MIPRYELPGVTDLYHLDVVYHRRSGPVLVHERPPVSIHSIGAGDEHPCLDRPDIVNGALVEPIRHGVNEQLDAARKVAI